VTVARHAPVSVESESLPDMIADAVGGGARFAGLVAFAEPGGATSLHTLLARGGDLEVFESLVPDGSETYRAVTPSISAAFWYEREIHDLFGLVPDGHPRLDPIVLPLTAPGLTPGARPGRPDGATTVDLDPRGLPGHVSGEGVFTIPYGPVRSGVFEAVEYVVETFGEDIPHLRVRPYVKHRGIARRFASISLEDGVLLAERTEGTMSVAHASAYCQALETITGVDPPMRAHLVRVLHAELERVACHLDTIVRHTEGAGQAVAYARMTYHKERVLRLRARLCGHRFGRGVVVPGGVFGPPSLSEAELLAELDPLERDVTRDAHLLMNTPSFLDRLRGTGVVPPDVAVAHGALGPLGRASGAGEDVRVSRPYGAYPRLAFEPAEIRIDGDALARQWVRLDEIVASFDLIRQAVGELAEESDGPWRVPLRPESGTGVGWVESPQGELVYLVRVHAGRVEQAKPRCAGFHNFELFTSAFGGDIFTDFVFIEASFGVSMAGVAG
jgi:formate hydrogenlyase subunit 5